MCLVYYEKVNVLTVLICLILQAKLTITVLESNVFLDRLKLLKLINITKENITNVNFLTGHNNS